MIRRADLAPEFPNSLMRTWVSSYLKSARLTLRAKSDVNRQRQLLPEKPEIATSTTDTKQTIASPWHGGDFAFDIGELRAFPVCSLVFQTDAWLSHFPLSTENLVPWGWNGFYVMPELPREEVPPSPCSGNAEPMEPTNCRRRLLTCACAPSVFPEGHLGFPFTWKGKC